MTESTLCSRDVFQELTQVSLKDKSGKIFTQKDTNLCAYFAMMSSLRHQLRKTVGSEKSGIDYSKIDPNAKDEKELEDQGNKAKKYAGLEINEYLDRKDQDEKRFERDLAALIGCVCPRSLSAWFKIK